MEAGFETEAMATSPTVGQPAPMFAGQPTAIVSGQPAPLAADQVSAVCDLDPPKRTYTLKGATFTVDARYTIERRLGAGAFGMVCAAIDTQTGEHVAVKRINNAFNDMVSCRKALREVRLMRHFEHENILGLRDIMLPGDDGTWTDLYLVLDQMDCDLHYIIHSRQTLSDGHVQWFVYQMLRGLKAIHSASAIHRDLKPSNLLVNKNCDLKICDFGFARALLGAPGDDEGDDIADGALRPQAKRHLTEYVVTRWYRAPELIAQAPSYGAAVDMWSAGCILAECLGRKVLLKGGDYLEMMRLIVSLLGQPSDDDLGALQNPAAAEYVQALPARPAASLAALYPSASAGALELLAQLLVFNPRRRLTAAQALAHPYLDELHSINEAPDAPPVDADAVADDCAQELDESELRRRMWAELQAFHPEVGDVPAGWLSSSSPARVMDLEP